MKRVARLFPLPSGCVIPKKFINACDTNFNSPTCPFPLSDGQARDPNATPFGPYDFLVPEIPYLVDPARR
jgi:hypothetical protein